MNQQKLFSCQDIQHENDDILGFCLNLGCKELRSQFCLQCSTDPMKHTNCKQDLKGFGKIQSLITKLQENLLNLSTQFNKQFTQVKTKYQEYLKFMETIKIHLNQTFAQAETKYGEYSIQMEKMNTQLAKLSESLTQQNYQYIKQNLQIVKEWRDHQIELNWNYIIYIYHDFLIISIVKRMIKAITIFIILIFKTRPLKQLQQGIQLKYLKRKYNSILNLQKWQQAYDLFSKMIKLSQKQSSFATFFQYISLQQLFFNLSISEMNLQGQGFIFREQAKKINSNLYRDLLNYSDLELKKNPSNNFMIIAKKIINLNDEKKYQQAVELCEKVLNVEPQHLHALYRKCFYINNSYYRRLELKAQAIECIDKHQNTIQIIVLVIYRRGIYQKQGLDKALYIRRGNIVMQLVVLIRLYNQIAIMRQPIIIKVIHQNTQIIDVKINNLKNYNYAITCFDKAIQLDPNNAYIYNNKGVALYRKQLFFYLKNLNKYDEALQNFNNSILIDFAQPYKNKGTLKEHQKVRQTKKYNEAIETYEEAIKNCKANENEFKRLITEVKNKK